MGPPCGGLELSFNRPTVAMAQKVCLNKVLHTCKQETVEEKIYKRAAEDSYFLWLCMDAEG